MKSTVDTPAYLAFAGRAIRAAGRRIADGDPDELLRLLDLHHEVDEAVVYAVVGLRRSGATWAAIGAATGTSKEAAVQKWAAKVKDEVSR